MALKRLVLVAFVVAVVLVPATSASAQRYPIPFRYSLVPLQKAQLGPAAASFSLNYDGSGDVPNVGATQQFLGLDNQVGFLNPIMGRIYGYALDYGDPLTGSAGVTEIRTGVEKYKSRAKAGFGLAFWKNWDSDQFTQYNSSVLPVTKKWLKSPSVGQKGFASLVTFAAPNLNPIVRLDEQVIDGRWILSVTVTAGSASAAEEAAPGLLRALDHRFHRVLAGKSVGEPAKLPYRGEPGQAPGGPDLSAAAFQLSDVGQSHWVGLHQFYYSDPFALSSYYLYGYPAGIYAGIQQNIDWWPSATEATYANAYEGNLYDGLYALLGGSITPVDLSALSDPAQGVLITGGSLSFIMINLTNGQADERVFASSESALTTTDVQNLAQAAAARLDAAIP